MFVLYKLQIKVSTNPTAYKTGRLYERVGQAVTPENEEGTRKYTRLKNELFYAIEQSPAVSAEAADRINMAFTQAIDKTELPEKAKSVIAQKFVLPSNIEPNSYEAERYARDFADDAALAYEAGEIQQKTGEKLPDGWLQQNVHVATPEQVDYYTKFGRERVLAEQVKASLKVDISNYDTFNFDDKYSRGTNLEYSERYSYKNLTSKSDIEVKKLPRLSETEIKKYQNDSILFGKDMRSIAAKSNNAKNTPTKTYIYCSDLGKDVLITRNSFKHGAARMDGTYIAVCKSIAEVLNNSIVVNELTDREYTQGGYVLLGLTETDDSYVVVRSIVNKKTWQLEDYNELYAVKKKSIKKEDVGLKPPHYVPKNGYVTSSVISILDFLKFVNSQNIGNNVLSLDVIKNLGSTRGVDEKITPNLMYNISPIKKVGQSVKSDTIPTNSSVSQSAQNVNKESLAIEAKKYTADTTERVQARKKLLARSADEVRTATRNDTTLTAEQREAAEFGEKIGVAVGFVDTTQYYSTKRDGISLKSKGIIILDKKTENPLKQVFIHELGHFSETSKTYAKLSKKIMESKALDNWLTEKGYTGSFANKKSAYRAEKKRAYSENGVALTKDGADAEMIANFLAETIGTEEKFNAFMSELTKEQKKNFLDYIKEVIDWFKATFTNSVPAEIRQIERLYKKAVRESADSISKSKSLPNTEAYSINFNNAETNKKIKLGMTDEERYKLLRNKKIKLTAEVNQEKMSKSSMDFYFDEKSIETLEYNARRKLIRSIGEQFGIFRDYWNSDFNLEFEYSKGNLKESIKKQKEEYYTFVKMLSCFDEVISNAIGIEVHNRNDDGYKPDITLKNVYVLVSAFVDGNKIVPVKLEVKEFFDKKNTLYVTITSKSIKKDEVVTQGSSHSEVPQHARSSIISLSELFKKVNPKDESFYKYIPKQFLEGVEFTGEIDLINSSENVNTEQFAIPGEEIVERKERTYGNSIPERTRKLRQDYADGKIRFDELVAGETQLMEEAREKYGTIEEGENPQERVKVPQGVEKNKNVSQYVRTILETGVVSEALAAEIGEKTLLGEFSHKILTDEKALEDADKAIKNGTARNKWGKTAVDIHRIPTKNEIAVGEKLLEKAMKDGKTTEYNFKKLFLKNRKSFFVHISKPKSLIYFSHLSNSKHIFSAEWLSLERITLPPFSLIYSRIGREG